MLKFPSSLRTQEECNRMMHESNVWLRFWRGIAIFLFLAICGGSLLYIAYEGNPGNFDPDNYREQKAIRTNDFQYFDTIEKTDPLADSCAKAIIEKYRKKHHVKTIEK